MRCSIDVKGELSPTPVKAGDDGRMPVPGHYAGQTSQDGTISFDVSPTGWHVSNLMLTVTARRPHGGRAVVDLPVAVGRIIPGRAWRPLAGESRRRGGDRRRSRLLSTGRGSRATVRVDIDSD